MTDVLPYIFKRETKKSLCGDVIEDKQLTVQGSELSEVKKIFDKEWKEKEAKK